MHPVSRLNIDTKGNDADYKKKIQDLQEEIKKLETELYRKVKAWQADLVKQVRNMMGLENVQQQF